MASEDPKWLLEPPAPGQSRIHIAVHQDANLSPSLRDAIDRLVRALHDDEVEGYATPGGGVVQATPKCPDLDNCTSDGPCRPRVTAPCASFQTCRIISST
jgi:hypothetical protein